VSTEGQARGGDRHGRVGDPVRAAIAAEVEQLHVFQRTPPWVMPHTSRRSRTSSAPLRRFPALQRLVRGGVYTARESLVLGFVKRPRR
jgi:cation diffusion facilitator CzcD-associated flavoprotein CzcO